MAQTVLAIQSHGMLPPVEIPPGHVGPLTLPGTDRQVWWTGRVAIGLRYERQHTQGALGQSAAWLQTLLLASARTWRAASVPTLTDRR